ncbi:MAG: pyrroloquinoline quinone biosynthesis protein PqqB [Acidobacteria bacterium]|nr:MAG: pyrroloquinoline quinone biosynthesis protein PqqB [Acidobacteriota bacterium]
MKALRLPVLLLLGLGMAACVGEGHPEVVGDGVGDGPYIMVLGIAQDAGVPQAGTRSSAAWEDPSLRRLAACLGLVDPEAGLRWMIEATPDFKDQLHRLDLAYPVTGSPGLAGIFLTHAHVGHYVGLMHLGHEVMGSRDVPVYAMPRMAKFLASNGPWDQLASYRNIVLRPLADGDEVTLSQNFTITPLRVPHREEYSEVVGFVIRGPRRGVLFIPDIDGWKTWDQEGTRIEEILATVNVAYLDGTFYDAGELPGRDLAAIPHPLIVDTMERLAALPASERGKVRFLHLNHSNPALATGGAARRAIEDAGFHLAVEGEKIGL